MKQDELQYGMPLTKRQRCQGFGYYALMIIGSLLAYFPALVIIIEEQINQTGYSRFSAVQYALLSLIQPLVLALIALLAGQFFFQKVGLHAVIYERSAYAWALFKDSLSSVLLLGLELGIGIGLADLFFSAFIPELTEMMPSVQSLLAGVFYGGVIEEIMLRFGLMTTIIYFLSRSSSRLKSGHYWLAISIVAIVFALGHLPMTLQLFEMTPFVWLRLLLLNGMAGMMTGYFYWRFTLESAILCHMMVHVGMYAVQLLLAVVL